MALNVLDRNTRDVMAASYAIPDLETAVQQVIYNAIDARAKTIRLMVNVADASFSAVDDGDGIQPDDLYKFIGDCFASSRVSQLVPTEKQQKAYGSRGAFLHEMIALAKVVEIESRVQDHWASWRKVFKEGKVSFNAASKQTRQAPGTKVCVSDLFGKLPVRRKDLLHNRKYRRHVIQNIYSFCVNMSMIWPSLSLDIQYEGEEVRPVIISAVKSCSERFQTHFGPVLGKELHYVTFSSKRSEFSIRGYFAFVPRGCEGLAQGIKQAKSYYQFAFLENQWVGECQQICSRVITDAALEYLAAIPIFVVKVAVPNDEYDILRFKTEGRVLFKAPEEFQNFLVEFVQSLTSPTENDYEQTPPCGLALPRLEPHQSYGRAEEPDLDYLQAVEPPVYSSRLQDPDRFSQASFSSLSGEDAEATCMTPRDQMLVEPQDYLLPSAAEDRAIWPIVFEEDYSTTQASTVCQACGHACARACEMIDNVEVMGSDIDFQDEHGSVDMSTYLIAEENDAGCPSIGRDDNLTTEGDLADIFFSSQTLVAHERTYNTMKELPARTPWLSSKPDVYDCADMFLGVYQDSIQAKSSRHHPAFVNQRCGHDQAAETETKQFRDKRLDQVLLQRPDFPPLTSTYFDKVDQPARSLCARWSRLATTPIRHLAAALQVDNVRILNGLQSIKVSKSTLADMKVIRQVDRKFILVQADTSRGKLLLCIDQHAADERVRLEKLEEEIFGRDGTLRRVEIQRHEPPLALRMNSKECEILHCYEEVIHEWGFSFEFTSAESERLAYVHNRSEVQEEEGVLLHTTPRVEKRAANGDDFRDFIELLASAGNRNVHSNIRPPVITRLLHSRACRSAIMFGDHLSTGHCRDLIAELKTCQLPFQCAHGRPSVVPLAEIQRNLSEN